MPLDYTQQQSSDDEQRSRQLSLKHNRPPIEIPGYKSERFLGAGAYGEVWVGLDKNTGRRVAIKFFAHRHGVDWSLLSREVEKLVFLSADRYVVQLMEVGWDSEPPYYVMEYIESGSLEDLLRDTGPLPLADAVEMFREICVGLSHAHGKGVLHCDLKPANILLDQDHRPRLADFGQSRLSSDQTPALGTLFYMAPEQADLAAVPDVRWDVYALGAIFHCILVGEPPHRSPEVANELESATDLPDRLARYRHAIQTAPPPQAHRRVHGIDRTLSEIIERCLAVNPDDRYANVQEIISALAQRQLARQRRPLIALGFVFPLLMLLVMAFFGWRGYQNAVVDTERLATDHAAENNAFAARLAAQQVAGEVADLFQIADDEANRRPVFREAFEPVRNHELLAKLADPEADPQQIKAWRQEFFADKRRLALDDYLRRRLEKHQRNPRLASIFVLDGEGTQVAAVFADGQPAGSVGRNLAFRSYFHGGPVDLNPRMRVSESLQPVTKTHLSNVFQSSTTGLWKVAVATPIREGSNGDSQAIGMFVITINLSDLEFLQLVQQDARERFAALVDGRDGEHQGLILQHPLFDELSQQGKALPDSFRSLRVPLDENGELNDKRYRDPLGESEFGKAYEGLWIASAVPVRLAGEKNRSGLVVLVQEDYLEVTGPVRQLASRLAREGVLALLVVLLVTALLWYAVLRLVREPRSLPRTRLFSQDATPLAGDATLPLGHEKVAG